MNRKRISTGKNCAHTKRAAGKTARIEQLECRRLMSVNVLVHHNDSSNDGANSAETVLTPANVNPTDFGKQFTTQLDGQVFAQPLYVQSEDITAGSSIGVHSVAYVATMHDSLYAIDANTGAILWHDSFLDITNPTNLTATTGVTTIPESALGDTQIGPELGILATPAIDLQTGMLFLNAATTEIRGANTHYVQRLWKVNIANGQATSTVIADTIFNGTDFTSLTGYQYVAGPIVNGTGNNRPTGPQPTYPNLDGWTSAPGGQSGYVLAYNALLQMQRTAVTLFKGNVYLASASHGDNTPFYGWILGYSESDLHLTAAFNVDPTYTGIPGTSSIYTAQSGIWMSGSAISTDGTNLYLVTGDGAFNPAPGNFNAQGFPIDHDYGDTLLKLTPDTSSTPSAQNGNGWGLKVADYFTPSNENALDADDLDFGSGGVTLLPSTDLDRAGHPMLVVGSKESRLYLIDIDNLGKFNYDYPSTGAADPAAYDRVVGEYANNGLNGKGHETYSSAAYFDGKIYIGFRNDPALAFDPNSLATGMIPPKTVPTLKGLQETSLIFGTPAPTFSISSNGDNDGIAWALNRTGGPQDDLLAYNALNITTPIYDSDTDYSRDSLTGGAANAASSHFAVPTVANGMVYVGTGAEPTAQLGAFVGYGLLDSYLKSKSSYFGAPYKLTATAISSTDTRLKWQDNASAATLIAVERSTDGSHWTTLAYVGGSTTTADDLSFTGSASQYYYRVVAISGANSTSPSNTVRLAAAAASISGTVFNDKNDNAKFDAGDSILAGWRVFLDLNNNGAWNSATEPSVLTDSSGNFTFDDLAPGTYIVRVIRPAGWTQTTPANGLGQHITVTIGQNVSNVFFGERSSA